MINLHERMLPTSAGVKPATSWSPVGRSSNWATEAGAAKWENVPIHMFAKHRLKSTCACAQSDQSFMSTWKYIASMVIQNTPNEFAEQTGRTSPKVRFLTLLCVLFVVIPFYIDTQYNDIHCIHGYPKYAQWRFWTDWAYKSKGTFPDIVVRIICSHPFLYRHSI